ncbi:Rieske (2Fe-2S) protein [Actinomadura luteofluorescens]|uniref:Rieske (2Fe-2S) protein n=1 Tax=Actinomadura luteofluorescens TaxID=46163 RepID=UPI00363E70BC
MGGPAHLVPAQPLPRPRRLQRPPGRAAQARERAALNAVEAYETGRDESERIVVADAGARYDIPRYCPHAGEDLSVGAVVRDGQIHCLAHNFAFDLATGECLNARAANLTSRAL